MSNIKLINCGHSTMLGKANSTNTELDVEIMALKPGIYYDMNGTEVEVTSKTIHGICDNYNEAVKNQFEDDKILTPEIEKIGVEKFDNRNAPNQLDHDDGTVLKTVGHVIGFMQVKDIDDIPHLFLTARQKGEENVLPVKDKRRRNVSVQYNPQTYEFVEISWVVKGAASSARALLSNPSNNKSTTFNNKSTTFKLELDKIRENETILLAQKKELEQKIAVKKYLVALCVNNKINRATADFIEHTIESKKIDNPLEVVKLMESIMPIKKFKPQYYKLAEKGDQEMDQNNTPVTLHDFIATVALKKDDGKRLSGEVRDDGEPKAELKNYSKEHALKHKELTEKMSEAYEKGDIEMGKKYKEKANKLAEDCAEGTANLSEYDIDEGSKDSDEVKKMAAKLEELTIALAKNKDEQNVALNKLKDDQMSVLASFTNKITENFNASDAKILLSKLNELQGVK